MNARLESNSIVEERLDGLLEDVAQQFGADALTWWGPITFGTDTALRRMIEEHRQHGRNKNLVVLLTTTGGIVEVVQRAVETIRHHYEVVDYVIADYAYSAGTVMAMSGDAIHMDYYARLGPIDPQVLRGDPPRLVPALGAVERYNELIKRSRDQALSDAEISVLIGSFDQAELYQFEQARELSISLLKDWLVSYKFKDWNVTDGRGVPVTPRMKRIRAQKIATELSKTARWHSHGTGISAEVLRKDLNLRIDDLDEAPERKEAISAYQELLEDYMMRRGHFGVLHMKGKYMPYHIHEF